MIIHLSPKLIPEFCKFIQGMEDHFLESCRIGSRSCLQWPSKCELHSEILTFINLSQSTLKWEAQKNWLSHFLPGSHQFWHPAMNGMRTYLSNIGWTSSKIQALCDISLKKPLTMAHLAAKAFYVFAIDTKLYFNLARGRVNLECSGCRRLSYQLCHFST